jgi:hypothetical protein
MTEKLMIRPYEDGFEIIGNREGLRGLAEICQRLADLPNNDEEARKLGNHYHYADYMNNVEEGSTSLTILYKPDL